MTSEQVIKDLGELLEVQSKILRISSIASSFGQQLSQETCCKIADILKMLHEKQKQLITKLGSVLE
jgi:hypothetical protein